VYAQIASITRFVQAKIPNNIKILNHTKDEPEMTMDVAKIENVFFSILQNGIDAIAGDGTIEVQSTQEGPNAKMRFTDSGVGIPENILSKLFTPLTTTKAKGMGMGLAICKRIIDAHGGKITVESTLGKGTTVIITLPIKPKIELIAKNDWIAPEQPAFIIETRSGINEIQ
jgi:signal transduction histidine kinase